MNYRYEFFPNEDCAGIHFSLPLIRSDYVSDSLPETADPLDREILDVLKSAIGVEVSLNGVSLRRYSVMITIAKAFERDEVLKGVLELVVMVLKMRNQLGDAEEIRQLTTIRSDIRYHLCEQCKREQEKLMESL